MNLIILLLLLLILITVNNLVYIANVGDSRCVGSFKDGKKHGFGVLSLSNDDKYTGDFNEDIIEGKGKYVWANGQVYEGDWANNKFNGKFLNQKKLMKKLKQYIMKVILLMEKSKEMVNFVMK